MADTNQSGAPRVVWATHITLRRQLKDTLHGRGDTPALRPCPPLLPMPHTCPELASGVRRLSIVQSSDASSVCPAAALALAPYTVTLQVLALSTHTVRASLGYFKQQRQM